jgi:hypothetical protein
MNRSRGFSIEQGCGGAGERGCGGAWGQGLGGVRGRGCRRGLFHPVFDGEPVDSLEVGGVVCDQCSSGGACRCCNENVCVIDNVLSHLN